MEAFEWHQSLLAHPLVDTVKWYGDERPTYCGFWSSWGSRFTCRSEDVGYSQALLSAPCLKTSVNIHLC